MLPCLNKRLVQHEAAVGLRLEVKDPNDSIEVERAADMGKERISTFQIFIIG